MGPSRIKFSHTEKAYGGPPAMVLERRGVLFTGGQFDAPQSIVYTFLPVEVCRSDFTGIAQGLRLQSDVSLAPGDGYRLPQGLLSAFIVALRAPNDSTVVREETPSLVGTGRYQTESTS